LSSFSNLPTVEMICLKLLENGLSWRDDTSLSRIVLLHEAVRSCMQSLVCRLLLLGAPASGRGIGNDTVLHVAAEHGAQLPLFQTLLNAGADLSATNKDGNTVAHIAVMFNREDIIALMMRYGLKLDVVNNHGQTPGALACSLGRLRIAQLFAARETDEINQARKWWIDAANSMRVSYCEGRWFSDNGFFEGLLFTCAANGNLTMMSELVTRGVSLFIRRKDDDSVLMHVAAANAHSSTIHYLFLNAPVLLNFINAAGNTPLLECLLALLPVLSNASTFVGNRGKPPVSAAARVEAAKLLIELGAELSTVNAKLDSALGLAVRLQNQELLDVLHSRGAVMRRDTLPEDAFAEGFLCADCSSPCNSDDAVVCGICRETYYCSDSCRLRHWNSGHYSSCTPASNDE
jgi:ankyrin repeat protein